MVIFKDRRGVNILVQGRRESIKMPFQAVTG
ncbi:hypothetical protein FHS20_003341 [Phyllobacterium endophyticum]|jgi:hypothetical protein|nr:hypothetical protein [Phyllobacterium endophyticum]